MKYPTTFAQLVRVIDRAGRLDAWAMGTLPAEPDDDSRTRRALWLADSTPEQGMVAFEFGRLIVTLGRSYWFELTRLHEAALRGWSWQQQVKDKVWCLPEHLRLLDELCHAIPANSRNPAAVRIA